MSVRRGASGRAHYNYFRDYDPAKGGYMLSDPIGLRGGMSTYAYVGGDPTTRFDPLGLEYGAAYSTILRHDRWGTDPGRATGTVYFGIEGSFANPGQPGIGGGVSWVTCTDECGKERHFRYYKICLAATSGVGATGGIVGGMSGKKCRESTYAGYFAEFGFGVDGVTAGVDIGLNNVAGTGPGTGPGGKGGTFPQPGAPSGVN